VSASASLEEYDTLEVVHQEVDEEEEDEVENRRRSGTDVTGDDCTR
jgi:hypothetical protein